MTAVDTPPKGATHASAWPTGEPELHTLPSGGIAVLKRPSLMEMMRRGEIPNPLIEAALAMAERRESPDLGRTADLVAFIVASAFVEPRCVYDGEPSEDEIAIEQVSDGDRTYVLAWMNADVAGLAPFREVAGGPDGGSDGSGVRDETE